MYRRPRSVKGCHRQAFHHNESIQAGRRLPHRTGRLAVLEASLTKETRMSTLKLSVVATAIIAAAVVISARTVGEPPACCPDSSKAGTGMLAFAGALVVQPDKDSRNAPAPAAATADFSVEGMFVDCCSCNPPCPCEVTEVAMGCKGVGVHQISRGTYAEDDLVGVKIAHAKVVGKWVNLYIDAKDKKQRAAAERFGRAAFAGFGPIKVVKAAKIEVSGAHGNYAVTVDGGKIMKFETEP